MKCRTGGHIGKLRIGIEIGNDFMPGPLWRNDPVRALPCSLCSSASRPAHCMMKGSSGCRQDRCGGPAGAARRWSPIPPGLRNSLARGRHRVSPPLHNWSRCAGHRRATKAMKVAPSRPSGRMRRGGMASMATPKAATMTPAEHQAAEDIRQPVDAEIEPRIGNGNDHEPAGGVNQRPAPAAHGMAASTARMPKVIAAMVAWPEGKLKTSAPA